MKEFKKESKPVEMEEVSFSDLETVEDIVTGSVSGLINCCTEASTGNFGIQL